jgi:2-keto-4-pentenoate hydratase/2-oxohepta-3-ene-1,7-dioic acid hydratase in catechol pathway
MIGDVLVSSLICENLKRNYPNSEVHYLINRFTIPVVENNPYIDEIIVFEDLYRSNKIEFFKFLKDIKKSNYDVVIDAYGKLESNLITLSSGAKTKISWKKSHTKFIYTHLFKNSTKPITNAGIAIEDRLRLLTPLNLKLPLITRTRIYLTDTEIKMEQVKLLHPVDPPNIIAIGKNYEEHVKESGDEDLPEEPVIFLKATTSINGPGKNIVLPEIAPDEVDFEAELAVIIGKKTKNVKKEEVPQYILGYTCANDVSARDCQLRFDQQWARGKSFDTFCPLGPWIETSLESNSCDIKSKLNGKVMQSSNTSYMMFNINELVSYCSRNMTLLPGTIILTGTPEGAGFARNPNIFLRPGDEIEIEIEGIGVLHNNVITEKKEKKKEVN